MNLTLARQVVCSIALALLLSGCAVQQQPAPLWKAAVDGDGPGDPTLINRDQVVVRNLPKSTMGNSSQYTVFGQTYRVLDTAKDFKEWGVATWYGKKFHGRATASGDIYDMHMLTAAHRHLPLPTFVRVTRIDNDRSVVVKVNDRGPFVHDRVIDLSYAAAAKLDMLIDGTADVYIEALSHHEGATDQLAEIDDATGPDLAAARPVAATRVSVSPAVAEPVVAKSTDASTAIVNSTAVPMATHSAHGDRRTHDASVPRRSGTNGIQSAANVITPGSTASSPAVSVTADEGLGMRLLDYVQVGAYSERDNAVQMMSRLSRDTDLPVVVDFDRINSLYRVRIGPMDENLNINAALEELAGSGITGYTVKAPGR